MYTNPSSYPESQSTSLFSRVPAIIVFVALLVMAFAASPSASSFFRGESSDGIAQAAFTIPDSWKKFFSQEPPTVTPTSTESLPTTIKIVSEESQVIEVVKNASDAVVSIIASAEVPRVTKCAQRIPIQGLPSGFERFFDIPALCQDGTELRRVGAGSGFIASSDGYIITNKHVVNDERGEYTVILNDRIHSGQKLKAKVIARSPEQDIAILKVEANDLPFLTLGDSSTLQVGQTAIAIGYALGEFDNTVSKGVVSGLFRSISASNGRSSEDLRGLIQTDAAINPGNSGGPLLDIAGNVIGMNTAVANAQSIGFAIPVNEIRNAFDQARTTGKISLAERAFLGIRYMPITAEMKAKNNLDYDYGIIVARGEEESDVAVVPGSPADKAGIRENTIILEVDGKPLNDRNQLSEMVAAHKPGEVIDLKIVQQGETKNVTVTLEKKTQ